MAEKGAIEHHTTIERGKRMNANDIEAMAHDLYEIHLYEKIRAEYPDLTPAQVAMRVIGALELGMNEETK